MNTEAQCWRISEYLWVTSSALPSSSFTKRCPLSYREHPWDQWKPREPDWRKTISPHSEDCENTGHQLGGGWVTAQPHNKRKTYSDPWNKTVTEHSVTDKWNQKAALPGSKEMVFPFRAWFCSWANQLDRHSGTPVLSSLRLCISTTGTCWNHPGTSEKTPVSGPHTKDWFSRCRREMGVCLQ